MSTALIGYTGFVGNTLSKQTSFDYYYNSKNIAEIRGKKFSTVICAGAPAVKWKANQEPEVDLANIQMLISHLDHIEVEEFVLISTVDVYKNAIGVDEDTPIDLNQLEPYGKHRYILEQYIKNKFANYSIIRLPGLFGVGLKKNIIYDLINSNCLHLTHKDSVFQFYNLSHLLNDIHIVRNNKINLINFSTEPVAVSDIAKNCFNIHFNTVTDKPPVIYDMKSKFSNIFNSKSNYMLTKEQVFGDIKNLIRLESPHHEISNL